jgi:hypothetical protein
MSSTNPRCAATMGFAKRAAYSAVCCSRSCGGNCQKKLLVMRSIGMVQQTPALLLPTSPW